MKGINGFMASREQIEKAFLRDEILDHATYTQLAKRERNKEIRNLLQRLANKEDEHIRTWRMLLDGEGDEIGEPLLLGVRVFLLTFVKKFLGIAFVTRLLERDENNGLGRYEEGLRSGVLKERDEKLLRKIIQRDFL